MEELENLNRQNNENILNNANNHDNVDQILENFNNVPNYDRRNIENRQLDSFEMSVKFIYSKTFLFISLLISIVILAYLHINFSRSEFTLKDLENDEMLISYFLILIVTSSLIWNFFLFINKVIFKVEHILNEDISVIDSCYYNPIFFNLFLFFLNKHFMMTSFDILAWWMIAFNYAVNYIFSLNLYNHSNYKINTITNFQAQTGFLLRMRLNYIVLMIINILFVCLMIQLTEEASFSCKYIVLFKGFYLFMKQIEFWVVNEINLIQLKSGSSEDFIFRTNSIRLYIQIVNMILILHVFIIANNFFLYNGSYLLFIILTSMIFKFIMDIRIKYKTYLNFKEFMSKLDSIFPKIALENLHEECTICKENLVNARKLSCNHFFHLICLSKWIEKGNKTCPLCRKDIELNLNGNEASNFWTFGLRLETNSIFSWLPNFSLRIIRTTAVPVTEESINSVSNIFPNIPREVIISSLSRTRNIQLTINEFLQR